MRFTTSNYYLKVGDEEDAGQGETHGSSCRGKAPKSRLLHTVTRRLRFKSFGGGWNVLVKLLPTKGLHSQAAE